MADQMTLAEAIAAVDSWGEDAPFGLHDIARTLRKALAETEDECRSLSALVSHQDIHLAKQERALDAIALALKAAREGQPVTGSSPQRAAVDSPVAPEGDENRGNLSSSVFCPIARTTCWERYCQTEEDRCLLIHSYLADTNQIAEVRG